MARYAGQLSVSDVGIAVAPGAAVEFALRPFSCFLAKRRMLHLRVEPKGRTRQVSMVVVSCNEQVVNTENREPELGGARSHDVRRGKTEF